MFSRSRRTETSTAQALIEAERAGLRLALIGRTVVLGCIIAWTLSVTPWSSVLLGGLVIGALVAIGLFHYWLILVRRDKLWHRYAFQTIDVAALGALVAFIPMSSGGDVPQIIAFRAYGGTYLVLVLAVAALSLSPGLMLWTGFVAVVALWAAFGWVVSGMDRTVSWKDMAPKPDAEHYLKVFLDPDFIGLGTRMEETILILATAGILALAVNRARRLVRQRVRAERQRAEVSQVLGRYVPREVVDELVSNEGLLSASTRDASILFVDIEGFTQLAERRPPSDVVGILNAYFGRVSAIAAAHRGVVISLIGDAAMIAFNAPLENDNHARSALLVARDLMTMSEIESFSGEKLRLRIGIAAGAVSAGSVGGDGRLSYTVYGDTVNVAQRLEQLNKQLDTRVLLTRSVRDQAGGDFSCKPIAERTIRGRTGEVEVFSLQ